MNQDRILQQLDKMVASGRVTEEEAVAVRSAEDPAEFEQAVGAIRARHAGAQMKSAIAAGDMTQADADAYLGRLYQGDHPEGLRARLTTHKRRAKHT